MRAAAIIMVTTLCLSSGSAFAQAPKKPGWYEKAVKKVEVTFDPAEAKPGQAVTVKLTLELNEGYYTYPTKQEDKNAAGMVNKIVYPEKDVLEFKGEIFDPLDYKTKSEPDLGIQELRYYVGKVVYERKAVVSASQKPGVVAVKIPAFHLSVCDAMNCFPSKKIELEGKLKVIAGSDKPAE